MSPYSTFIRLFALGFHRLAMLGDQLRFGQNCRRRPIILIGRPPATATARPNAATSIGTESIVFRFTQTTSRQHTSIMAP
jgi:hypothetical protein